MATLISITAKAVTTQGYQLQTPTDMLNALSYLATLPQPYTGSINANVLDGAQTWWLTIVNPHGTGSTGYINDWVILENNNLATITRAVDFNTFYTVS